MNKMSNRKRVVLLLPILISLALVISVNALQQENSEVKAHVNVNPTGIVDCRPDVLNLQSKDYITCFIELEGANAEDIDISTVRLSAEGKSGFVEAELNPNLTYIDDYDYDGIQDLMVKFNRSTVEKFFTGLTTPTYFNFNVSGYAGGFPFWGIDAILVTKLPGIKLVRYLQMDSKELGDGKINHIESLDINKYSTTFTHFSGYFFTTSPSLHGFSSFYFQGKIKKQFLGIPYYKAVTVLAQMNQMNECYALDNTVHCEGEGFLIIKPGSKFNLDHFSFDIKDNKVTIAGGKYFSDMLSIEDIPVNIITIKYK